MAHRTARLRGDTLVYQHSGQEFVLSFGSSAWWQWLNAPDARSFRFEQDLLSFTARRELQRGHPYWYAYRRTGQRVYKAYLGRSAELTLTRLETIAARLAERVAATAPPRQA